MSIKSLTNTFLTARICSHHFCEEDFERDFRNELLNLPPQKILKPDANPSLKLLTKEGPLSESNKRKISSDKNRSNRVEKRARKELVKTILTASIEKENLGQKDAEVQVDEESKSMVKIF